ncbi:hypothetical protein C8F04DRAFT_1271396 [Mycena alexandri]|uniref:DUF7702 domain-containing protein n=1 Tax=Mycena alexandri TaxID=1745969 RepID=A0AAD6S9L7_9AGAR|nr:hypothetical protein C8F04DRAFT_1271396 [Mycena alexandri]
MANDLAAAFGFESIPAAVILAIIYFPLFLWFIRQSIKNTTYVYISLTVFCLMRVVAFALRAILIASTSLGNNKNVLIAAEVMFGVGFFALLYSAFTLVLDREIASGAPSVEYLPLKIMRDRRLFRIVLIIGVVLGVMGISDATSSDPKKAADSVNTRRASAILFLVLTVIQAVQTALALNQRRMPSNTGRFGDRHGKYILCLISIFLLVREIFQVVTILGDAAKQNDERLWYPFVALPELLAVACYSVSGLVPTRAELKKQTEFEYIRG